MSTGTSNNLNDQEIDLSVISKKISGFFRGISTSIFKGILYVKKHSIVLFSLLIIGVGIGYFLDKIANVYDHQLIVTPNLNSVDYLYNKIDLLESKINTGDTVFLKAIGIKNTKKLLNIEVEPIVDIYSFVNDKTNTVENAQNSQNFELVKLLAEDGDINKVIKEKTTSKNYTTHNIKITTEGLTSEKEVIEPILSYLNDNEYFQKIQKVYIENTALQIAKGEETLKQIDAILNQFTTTANNNQKNDKLVYYNENTQLNSLIQTKNYLVIKLMSEKMELINVNQIIKLKSSVLNIKNNKGLNNKLKFIVPFLLISLYLFLRFILAFYKKQSLKAAQNIA